MPATSTIFQRALDEYRRSGAIAGFSGGDGSENPPTPPATPPVTPPVPTPPGDPADLGDAGKRAIEAEREARKAADKRAKDLETELARFRKDQQDRDDAEAAKKGEWEKLAKDRETELADLKAKHEGATGELDALRTYFAKQYDDAMKKLPDALKAFKPADDADFATKSAYLTTALAQADKLGTTTTTHGNRPNPKPGDTQHIDIAAATNQVRRRVSIL